MARSAFSSIRSRLTVLILLVVLPAFGLITYRGVQAKRDAAVRARSEALRTARLAVAGQEQLIETAHQLLFSIAQLPPVQKHEAPACDALFATLVDRFPRYAGMGLIGTDGTILASSLSTDRKHNFANDELFQRCLRAGDFVVGRYEIGKLTRKPVVVFGFPVVEPKGETGALLFLSLDLGWLNYFTTEAQLPAGSVVTAIDSSGTVLAQSVDPEHWVGRPFHIGSSSGSWEDQIGNHSSVAQDFDVFYRARGTKGGRNRRWGCEFVWRCTQGSSFVATLGWSAESLWDSAWAPPSIERGWVPSGAIRCNSPGELAAWLV